MATNSVGSRCLLLAAAMTAILWLGGCSDSSGNKGLDSIAEAEDAISDSDSRVYVDCYPNATSPDNLAACRSALAAQISPLEEFVAATQKASVPKDFESRRVDCVEGAKDTLRETRDVVQALTKKDLKSLKDVYFTSGYTGPACSDLVLEQSGRSLDRSSDQSDRIFRAFLITMVLFFIGFVGYSVFDYFRAVKTYEEAVSAANTTAAKTAPGAKVAPPPTIRESLDAIAKAVATVGRPEPFERKLLFGVLSAGAGAIVTTVVNLLLGGK